VAVSLRLDCTFGGGCIFCEKAASSDDRENLVVLRAERNFLLLNLYPYTTGHLMIAPYEHVATLSEAGPATLDEMMRLTARAEKALGELYRPGGFNIGMNIGECAGAVWPGIFICTCCRGGSGTRASSVRLARLGCCRRLWR
jgi:ATP adenylyltransferase